MISIGNLKRLDSTKDTAQRRASTRVCFPVTKATIIVEGWIKCVYYGAFVKRVASQLELKGLVRALPYGKVEGFLRRNFSKIKDLLKIINHPGKKNDL
jgi:acylphosphatase